MGVADLVAQSAEAVHEVLASAENRLENRFGVLARRESKSLGHHLVELRQILLVVVGPAGLVENSLADRLQ